VPAAESFFSRCAGASAGVGIEPPVAPAPSPEAIAPPPEAAGISPPKRNETASTARRRFMPSQL